MEQLDVIHLAERLRWEREQQEYWLHLEAASPLEKYPAKQHAQRVRELLGVADGLIYLAGEPKRSNEDSDMPAPWRQRRYFYYLSGVDEADCHLVYNINSNTLSLFIPRVDPARVIYEGRGSTPAEALDKYDIDQVFFADELEQFVVERMKYFKGPLYLLHSWQTPLSEPINEPVDSSTLKLAMNAARIIKDEHEIKQIRKANEISSEAHKQVLANILKFKNEAQVEGLFRDICISKLAKEQAYNPIAASGRNAGTLHYDSNNEDFDDRQLICLDAGCEWKLYASDITRTFPLSGSWPSQESKDIHSLVQRMQDACIERVKPGVRYLDLHILAHQVAVDGLLTLGLLHNGTAEEILKAGTSRAFFPHGLGHHVGLEVHDIGQGELMSISKLKTEAGRSLYPDNFHLPVYSRETCWAPCDPKSPHLEEGMVVTIEPGIYFNAYLLNLHYLQDPVHSKYINTPVVNRYLPVGGVRIEDDILVTRTSYENLTTAPKGEAMLEIIRSQNAHWPFISESADMGPAVSAQVDQGKSAEPRTKPAPKVLHQTNHSSSTKPKLTTDKRKSVDFEPYKGPSLYAGFSRSTTTDENVQRWRESRHGGMVRCQSPEPMAPPKKGTTSPCTSVCGENSTTVAHAYLHLPGSGSKSHTSASPYTSGEKPNCYKCIVLVQTIDRLRQNLSKVDQVRVKPSVQPTASRAPEVTRRPRASQTMPILPSGTAAISSQDTLKEKILTLEQKIGVLEKKLSIPQAGVKKFLPNRQSLSNPQAKFEPSAAPRAYTQATVDSKSSSQSWSQALSRGSDIRTEQLKGLARANTMPIELNQVASEAHPSIFGAQGINFYQDQLMELEAKNRARLLRQQQAQDGAKPVQSFPQLLSSRSRIPEKQTSGSAAPALNTLANPVMESMNRNNSTSKQADKPGQGYIPYVKPLSFSTFQSGPSAATQDHRSDGQVPLAKASAQTSKTIAESKCERCRIMDLPCSGSMICHFCSQLRLPCERSIAVQKPLSNPLPSISSEEKSVPSTWKWSRNGLQSRHVPETASVTQQAPFIPSAYLVKQNQQQLAQAKQEQKHLEPKPYTQLWSQQEPPLSNKLDRSTGLPESTRLSNNCPNCSLNRCVLHHITEPASSDAYTLKVLTDAMEKLWGLSEDIKRAGAAHLTDG